MESEKSKTKRKRPAFSITFFLTGILVVSLSLLLLNCGDSKQKAIEDGGRFALDLSLADAGMVGYVSISNPNREKGGSPSLEGMEFTVEAWIKSRTANLNGGVFARYADGGIALYVKDNVPKFTLRLPSSGTSTDYIVESNVSINQDVWQHVAAVLVDESHVSAHSACAGAEAELPHLDIYIDGVFAGCASTVSSFAPVESGVPVLGRLFFELDGLGDINFDGIIDEVRLYGIAKTAAEINETRDRKLTEDEMASDDLINYWKNNVGKGYTAVESSGAADNGAIYQCVPGSEPKENPDEDEDCAFWDSSWVAGDWP